MMHSPWIHVRYWLTHLCNDHAAQASAPTPSDSSVHQPPHHLGHLTYVAGGILLTALVGAFTNQHWSLLTLSLSALGALLPDGLEHRWFIEHFGLPSVVSSQWTVVSHSLAALAFLGVILSPVLATDHWSLATALLLGYAAHLFLDAATPTGVLLFYPSRARAVLPRYVLHRIEPGSPREHVLQRWLIALALAALCLNVIGIRRLLHRLIPAIQFAVEDYITDSSQGRRVFVDFTGRFNATQRPISGTWEVLDAPSRVSLLIEDPQGIRYTLGSHPHDTILAFHARATSKGSQDVTLQRVHLDDQSLLDLVPHIPGQGTTYLIGAVELEDSLSTQAPVDRYETLHAGPRRLECRYATLQDLHEAYLLTLHIRHGDLLLRTVTDGPSNHTRIDSTIPTISLQPSHQIITLNIPHLHNAQELLVHVDQAVTQGEVLAELRTYRADLLAKRQAAQAHLATVKATLQQLLATYRQDLAVKHAEDDLLGIHRDLPTLLATHIQRLTAGQSAVITALSRLDALDHELSMTTIASPLTGRVISIHRSAATAILRLLADA